MRLNRLLGVASNPEPAEGHRAGAGVARVLSVAAAACAVPDCIVSGHEPLIEGLQLRDPDDRHVLAAAIKAGAQVIVTSDKDFTREALVPWNVLV